MEMDTLKKFPVPRTLTSAQQEELQTILSNYEWMLAVIRPVTGLEQAFVASQKDKLNKLRGEWDRRIV